MKTLTVKYKEVMNFVDGDFIASEGKKIEFPIESGLMECASNNVNILVEA